MAKYLVRYLLEGNGTIPIFVEDGGHFKVGEEFVGRSVDASHRHLPLTVHRVTREELITRIVTTRQKLDGSSYSQVEAEALADTFLAELGLNG